MLEFFIGFQIGGMMQLGRDMKVVPTPGTHAPIVIPILPNDPSNPAPGSLWMDSSSGMLKICLAPGVVRILAFGSGNAVTPLITLATYFDMVVGLLLSFGLAFQLPLVVLALVR